MRKWMSFRINTEDRIKRSFTLLPLNFSLICGGKEFHFNSYVLAKASRRIARLLMEDCCCCQLEISAEKEAVSFLQTYEAKLSNENVVSVLELALELEIDSLFQEAVRFGANCLNDQQRSALLVKVRLHGMDATGLVDPKAVVHYNYPEPCWKTCDPEQIGDKEHYFDLFVKYGRSTRDSGLLRAYVVSYVRESGNYLRFARDIWIKATQYIIGKIPEKTNVIKLRGLDYHDKELILDERTVNSGDKQRVFDIDPGRSDWVRKFWLLDQNDHEINIEEGLIDIYGYVKSQSIM